MDKNLQHSPATNKDEPIVEYKFNDAENTALNEAFDMIFEKLADTSIE